MVFALRELLAGAGRRERATGQCPVVPEKYAQGATEAILLCVVFGWITTALFKPVAFRSNPLKDVIGYNTLCVGMDTMPARSVCLPFILLYVHLSLRYSYLDTVRADLDLMAGRLTRRAHRGNLVGNVVFATTLLVSPNFLIVTPFDSFWGHLNFFLVLIFGNWMLSVGNLLEGGGWAVMGRGARVWLVVYTLWIVAYPTIALVDWLHYDQELGGEQPPAVPWWLAAAVDYGLFVVQGVQALFVQERHPLVQSLKIAPLKVSEMPTALRRAKLLDVERARRVHARSPRRRALAAQIPCPALATLYGAGELQPATVEISESGVGEDGEAAPVLRSCTFSVGSLRRAFDKVGFPASVANLVLGAMGSAAQKAAESADAGVAAAEEEDDILLDVIRHADWMVPGGVNHAFVTGVRVAGRIPNADALESLLAYGKQRSGEAQRWLTARDMHHWAEAQAVEAGNAGTAGTDPALVLAMLVEVFGDSGSGGKQGSKEGVGWNSAISESALRCIFLDSALPAAPWKPHVISQTEVVRELARAASGWTCCGSARRGIRSSGSAVAPTPTSTLQDANAVDCELAALGCAASWAAYMDGDGPGSYEKVNPFSTPPEWGRDADGKLSLRAAARNGLGCTLGVGFELEAFESHAASDAQAAVLWHAGRGDLLLAVRGTDSATDTQHDLKFVKTVFEPSWDDYVELEGCSGCVKEMTCLPKGDGVPTVHMGFYQQLLSIVPFLERHLDVRDRPEVKRLIFCGHSLGAAVVTLAMAHALKLNDGGAALAKKGVCVHLVSVGGPRVGSRGFCTLLESRLAPLKAKGLSTVTRLAIGEDVIAHLPPRSMGAMHHGDAAVLVVASSTTTTERDECREAKAKDSSVYARSNRGGVAAECRVETYHGDTKEFDALREGTLVATSKEQHEQNVANHDIGEYARRVGIAAAAAHLGTRALKITTAVRDNAMS